MAKQGIAMTTLLQATLQTIASGTAIGTFLAIIAIVSTIAPVYVYFKRKTPIELSKVAWLAIATAAFLYVTNAIAIGGIVGLIFQVAITMVLGLLGGTMLAYAISQVEEATK